MSIEKDLETFVVEEMRDGKSNLRIRVVNNDDGTLIDIPFDRNATPGEISNYLAEIGDDLISDPPNHLDGPNLFYFVNIFWRAAKDVLDLED